MQEDDGLVTFSSTGFLGGQGTGEMLTWTMAEDWLPRASHRLMGEKEAQRWHLARAIFLSAKIELEHLLCARPCSRLCGGQ